MNNTNDKTEKDIVDIGEKVFLIDDDGGYYCSKYRKRSYRALHIADLLTPQKNGQIPVTNTKIVDMSKLGILEQSVLTDYIKGLAKHNYSDVMDDEGNIKNKDYIR